VEVKIPFYAPKKPGSYILVVHLLCDSYVGFDQKKTVKLSVHKELEVKTKAIVKAADEDGDLDEDFSGSEDEKDTKKGDESGSESDSD